MADVFQESINQLQDSLLNAKLRREKKEAQFLQDINVDPVTVMTNSLMDKQAKKIQEFNDNWIKNFSDTNGDLSMQQRVEMQKSKNEILSWQQKQQNALKDWQRSYEIVRDPRTGKNYDINFFEQQTQRFKDTDEIPNEGFLQARAKSLDELAKAITIKGNEATFAKTVGNKEIKTTIPLGSQFKTMDEAIQNNETMVRGNTNRLILEDPSYLRGAQEQFLALPDQEKAKYFKATDINNDNITDEREAQNAILLFAQDFVISKGATGIKVTEDVQKDGDGFNINFSSDKKSRLSNIIDINSDFHGKQKGVKVIGNAVIDVPSYLLKDKFNKEIGDFGDTKFKLTNILSNNRVEGVIRIPPQDEEIQITKQQAQSGMYENVYQKEAGANKPYYAKVKSPSKSVTVQTNLADIEPELTQYFPNLNNLLGKMNIQEPTPPNMELFNKKETSINEADPNVKVNQQKQIKQPQKTTNIQENSEIITIEGTPYKMSDLIISAKKVNPNMSESEIIKNIKLKWQKK